jgi:hypothetical protein
MQNDNASDLAQYIYLSLEKEAEMADVMPEQDVLTDFFETLFYTSLNTEEGAFIKVTVCFFDPDPVHAKISARRKDRWRFVPFARKLPFNVPTLVKLSKAADPWSTSLAVYYDSQGKLWVYGLIDQALHIQSYLNYEADSKPEAPGIFLATVEGVGILSVIRKFGLLATFKQNVVIRKYSDVFSLGVISDLLKQNFLPLSEDIKTFVRSKMPKEDFVKWGDFSHAVFLGTLSRILIRIRNYGR